MKSLPLHRRPYFARTVLEVGGGHAPFSGVTHAVDKFPESNSQRAGDLQLAGGVEFSQGDLEKIPFSPKARFDFFYASHVLEHVHDPVGAISEINRVASRGYLATPSPLREQLTCPSPFDSLRDFHTYFCWAHGESGTVHMVKKTAERIGEFCLCSQGRFARYLSYLHRNLGYDLEPLLPRVSKESELYFKSPLQLKVHSDFQSACTAGACAYRSVHAVERWSSFPYLLYAKRFRVLRKLLKKYRSEFFDLEMLSESGFKERVLGSSTPVAVAFLSKWSGSSRAMAPKLSSLSEEFGSRCQIYGVDVERLPQLALQYKVNVLPTVLIFRNQQLSLMLSGNAAMDKLKNILGSVS